MRAERKIGVASCIYAVNAETRRSKLHLKWDSPRNSVPIVFLRKLLDKGMSVSEDEETT